MYWIIFVIFLVSTGCVENAGIIECEEKEFTCQMK